jgi:hypothetical protein
MDQLKLIAATIGLSAIAIAVITLAIVAIPIVIGVGITFAIYVLLRILNEDVD